MPDLQRIPSFYHGYVSKVSNRSLQDSLTHYREESMKLLTSISEDQWDYAYAEGKWTIKELVQHLIDAERVFAYRALRFARRDQTELPGFDENLYASTCHAGDRKKADLLQELELVQSSSIALFNSFSSADLDQEGISNGNKIYVEAIGYIIAGHTLHHLQIIRERYLNKKG